MTPRIHLALIAIASLSLPLAGCGSPTAADLQLSSMQKSVEGDHIGALADIDEAIVLAPGDPGLYLVRGGIHQSMGNLAGTVADYEKVIELNPMLEAGLSEQLEHLRDQLPSED